MRHPFFVVSVTKKLTHSGDHDPNEQQKWNECHFKAPNFLDGNLDRLHFKSSSECEGDNHHQDTKNQEHEVQHLAIHYATSIWSFAAPQVKRAGKDPEIKYGPSPHAVRVLLAP